MGVTETLMLVVALGLLVKVIKDWVKSRAPLKTTYRVVEFGGHHFIQRSIHDTNPVQWEWWEGGHDWWRGELESDGKTFVRALAMQCEEEANEQLELLLESLRRSYERGSDLQNSPTV